MENNTTTTYSYKSKSALVFILMLIMFGASFGSVYAILINDASLRVYGITHTPTELKVVFSIIFLFTFYIGCKCCIAFFIAIKGGKLIELTQTSITSPRGVSSSKYVTIEFKNISKIDTEQQFETLLLFIHHSKGKLIISSAVMESKEQFQQLVTKIKNAMKGIA